MTPDKQRTAIAEACGYSAVSFDDRQHVDIDGRSILMWTQWMGEKHGVRIQVPAYVNDLNAMHEAEKVLTPETRPEYLCQLFDAATQGFCGLYPADENYLTHHATAAQRAEAFLRTLGKWEASK